MRRDIFGVLNDFICDVLRAIRMAIGVRETDSNLVARLRMIYLMPYIVIGLMIIWSIKIPFYLVAMAVVLVWQALAEYAIGIVEMFGEIFRIIGDRWDETLLMWRWNKP